MMNATERSNIYHKESQYVMQIYVAIKNSRYSRSMKALLKEKVQNSNMKNRDVCALNDMDLES